MMKPLYTHRYAHRHSDANAFLKYANVLAILLCYPHNGLNPEVLPLSCQKLKNIHCDYFFTEK